MKLVSRANKGDDPMSDLTVETITPRMAGEYLAHNEDNRKLRLMRVDQYAIAMQRGMWHFTGDPIVFDYHGRLIQGQHRLAACVKADVPFVTAVLRNADPAMYGILDSGLTRSTADGLGHAGIKSPNQVAAVARHLLMWRAGRLVDNVQSAGILREDIIDFAVKHGDALLDAYNWASKIKYAVGVNQTATGAFIFEVNDREGDERLHSFFDVVVTGEGLVRGDPRLAYRNWAGSLLSQQTREARLVHLANTIRAWNHMVLGNELRVLKNWRRGFVFPELIADI